MTASHNGDAYNVYDIGSRKKQHRSSNQTRNNSGNDRGRRKSSKINMEWHYCCKKGHLKKDCYALKSKEKDNAKSKGDGHGDNLMVPLPRWK